MTTMPRAILALTALLLVALAVSGTQPRDVVAYLIALEYMETLPNIAKDGERVFLPYEASSLMASVGSMSDLLGKLPVTKSA